MIADKKTNMVYFSSLIKTKYPLFWKKLEEILQGTTEFFPGLTIPYSMLEGTRSVWCRDYMPIQKDTHEFVQFTYFPDYLLDPKYIHEITIPDEIKRLKIFEAQKSNLIIDGGNIVKSESVVIMTDKIFKDNYDLTPESIIKTVKKELGIKKIHVIPRLPSKYDYTGHADGMVRLIDDKTLLVNDYTREGKAWRYKMDEALEKTELKIEILPYTPSVEKTNSGDYTAIGACINFAQIGNIILFPIFGLPKDMDAMEKIAELHPDCTIIPVESTDISRDGGALNCITWNILSVPKMSFNSLDKKTPTLADQEKYVYSHLDFYLSNYDYSLIEAGFAKVWSENTDNIIGDGNIKNQIYRFIEAAMDKNHMPQFYIDTTVDLILEYMESIGEYGFDYSNN